MSYTSKFLKAPLFLTIELIQDVIMSLPPIRILHESECSEWLGIYLRGNGLLAIKERTQVLTHPWLAQAYEEHHIFQHDWFICAIREKGSKRVQTCELSWTFKVAGCFCLLRMHACLVLAEKSQWLKLQSCSVICSISAK